MSFHIRTSHGSNVLQDVPSLVRRVAEGRPVITRERLLALSHRLLQATTFNDVQLSIAHTVRMVTRLANNRVLLSDDGDTIEVQIGYTRGPFVYFNTNQLDDRTLVAGITECERLLRASATAHVESWMHHEIPMQDTPVSVNLWHEPTVQAMTSSTARETMASDLLRAVTRAQLQASGFVGLMARAETMLRKDGDIVFYNEETDSEITMTARSRDGTRSGWGGQAARDWSMIRPADIAQRAIRMATLEGAVVAVEPGRRTAILTSTAMAQIVRFLAKQFDARDTDGGETALSKSPHGGNKLRQRVVDPRLTMTSDPADPDGGYRPFFDELACVATPPMTWIEHGTLKNMAYDKLYAMDRGKTYADLPFSLRMTGGETTVDEMIASCREGIYVNQFSDLSLVDRHSALLTGVTRDGCFLVKNGQIVKAIKNFRFLESPFFFLNKIDVLGAPERAAFGYTPQVPGDEWWRGWPRPPVIVPPMMVRDFNFSALADFV